MSHLGVNVPAPMRDPPRLYARLASAIWLAVSAPFFAHWRIAVVGTRVRGWGRLV